LADKEHTINITHVDKTGTSKTTGAKTTKLGVNAAATSVKSIEQTLQKALNNIEKKLGKELVKALKPILKEPAITKGSAGKEQDVSKILKPLMKKLSEDIVKGMSSKEDVGRTISKSIESAVSNIEKKIGKQLAPDVKSRVTSAIGGKVSDVAGKDVAKTFKSLDKTISTLSNSVNALSNAVGSAKKLRKSGGGLEWKEIPQFVKDIKSAGQEFLNVQKELSDLKKSVSDLKGVTKEIKESFSQAASTIKRSTSQSYAGVKKKAKDDPFDFGKMFISQIKKASKNIPELEAKITPKLEKLEVEVGNIDDLQKKIKKLVEELKAVKDIKIDSKGAETFLSLLDKASSQLADLSTAEIFGDSGKEIENKFKSVSKLAKDVKKTFDDLVSVKISPDIDTKKIRKEVGDAVKEGVNDGLKGAMDFYKYGKGKASVSTTGLPNSRKPLTMSEFDLVAPRVIDKASLTSKVPTRAISSIPRPDEFTKNTVLKSSVVKAAEDRIKDLNRSLNDLQDYMIKTLTEGFKKGKGDWAIVRKQFASEAEALASKGEYFKRSGGTTAVGGKTSSRQWKLQIADVAAMRRKVGDFGGDIDKLVKAYRQDLINNIAEKVKDDSKHMQRLIGKWVKMSSASDIKEAAGRIGLGPGAGERLVEAKKTESSRGSKIVSKALMKDIGNIVGEDLVSAFKETWGRFDAQKQMMEWKTVVDELTGKKTRVSPVLRSVAVPAAQVSRTGGTIFETATGSQRGISRFATYKSGFENLFDMLKNSAGFSRGGPGGAFSARIREIGVNPRDMRKANELAQEMFAMYAKLGGPEAKGFIKEQYKSAATMRGVKLTRAGVEPTVSGFEKKVDSVVSAFEKLPDADRTLSEFIKRMDEAGVSAYDVIKSLDAIKFENVYDIYKKVLEGATGKGPLKEITYQPSYDKPYRDFEKSIRQVEQLMPIVEAKRPRRGVHQENVVQLLAETSDIWEGVKPKTPTQQKDFIKEMNVRLDELFEEARMLRSGGKYSTTSNRLKQLPTGARTITSLGIPEAQASSYVELRRRSKAASGGEYDQGTEYLRALGAVSTKMYSDNLTELAPFGKQFTQIGRNIANVTNSMSSSLSELQDRFKDYNVSIKGIGTEFPALRTEREKELISSGRYGTKGYGFNVLAELRSTVNTFEDQVIISGKLAEALTESVKTIIKPSEAGRISGRDVSDEGLITSAGVGDVRKGVLADTDAINKILKTYQEILGFPEKYEGRADKALISEVEKVMTVVRSSDVEVQAAKLAEVFMNYFGRKFTTRYGSKGVGISPLGLSEEAAGAMFGGKVKVLSKEERAKAGLGVARMPKSMGELVSEILDKKRPGEFGELKDALITSGNKFIIDLFTEASKGIAVPEEASKQKNIFSQASKALEGIVDLKQGAAGISGVKAAYGSVVGGPLFKEKPIDIRISSYGIGKRGLQPEVLEAAMSNIIGGGPRTQTTIKTQFDEDVYKSLLGTRKGPGTLSKYSKVLGFESAGKKEDILKDLRSKYTEELAERAAKLEAESNFYVQVIDELGKKRQGLVGEKFLSIVEEPHETKEWTKSQIEKGAKGIKLNIPAFSAYSTIFGTDSDIMKEIKEKSSELEAEQWEYIKAFLASSLSKGSEEYKKQLTANLGKVDVGGVKEFEFHTGTFSKTPGDERSMAGTLYDLEKFYKPFLLQIPKTTGKPGERESMYVPGALARGMYPEPSIAGEYGPSRVPRRLQHIVNMSHRALGIMQEGDVLKSKEKTLLDRFSKASTEGERTSVGQNIEQVREAIDDWKTGRKFLTSNVMEKRLAPTLANEIKRIISSGDINKMSEMASRFAEVISKLDVTMPPGYKHPNFTAGSYDELKKALGDAMDLLIGPKNLEENLNKANKGLELLSRGETVESNKELLGISKTPAFLSLTKQATLKDKLSKFIQLHGAKASAPRGLLDFMTTKGFGEAGRYNVAKGLGIEKKLGITPEERYSEELAKLEKAKIDYYNELAQAVTGKTGAIAGTMFTRRIPSVLGKAVNAVVDKRKEFVNFSNSLNKIKTEYGDIEGVGLEGLEDISKATESIRKGHEEKINKYRKAGLPILKERELGVPAEMAMKIPASFIKRFGIEKREITRTKAAPVKGTLLDLLKYKEELTGAKNFMSSPDVQKYIEDELVPYIESVRFPFTGVSSVQPYKAKLLKPSGGKYGKDLTRHSLVVPGMPDLDYEKLGEQTDRINKIIEAVSGKREKLRDVEALGGKEGEKASVEIARLTSLINELNKALIDIIPKYIAVQQKLDFDGDTIQIHSATLKEARQDIKSHYESFGKDLDSISTEWAKEFTGGALDPLTGKYPLAGMLAGFEKRYPQEKGFEFLKKPFLSRELEYLPTEKQLSLLSDVSSKDITGLMHEIIQKSIRGSKSEVLAKAVTGVKEPTGEKLLEAVKNIDDEAFKLIKEEIRESVFSSKFKDAIEAQLFKLHTGTDVEALNRLQSMVESKLGFGKKGMLGGGPGGFQDTHIMMNELYRFAVQKGMDVKHAGAVPVAGEIVKTLSKGDVAGLWSDIQTDESYKELKEFADSVERTIKGRMGKLSTAALRTEMEKEYSKRGLEYGDIPAGREAMVSKMVEFRGFKGFLESLVSQIQQEAVKGIMKVHGYSDVSRAIVDLENMMKKTGVSINKYISEPKRPLYGFRTFSSSPQAQLERFEAAGGKINVPELATTSEKQKAILERSYKEAEATARNLRDTMLELTSGKGKGSYSEMIRSTIDNLYKDQERIEEIVNKTKGMNITEASKAVGYDIYSKSGLKELSRLAGIPELSRREKASIREQREKGGVGKEALEYAKGLGLEGRKLEETADRKKELLIEEAQALAQFSKVMEVLRLKSGEGKVLENIIPKPGALTAGTVEYDKWKKSVSEGVKDGVTDGKKVLGTPSGAIGYGGDIPKGPRGVGFPPQGPGDVYKVFIVGAAKGVFSSSIGRKRSYADELGDWIGDTPEGTNAWIPGYKNETLSAGKDISDVYNEYAKNIKDLEKTKSSTKFLKAEPIIEGTGLDFVFDNLKRLHEEAKEFQRSVGVSKETSLMGLPKEFSEIGEAIEGASKGMTSGSDFYTLINRLREEEGLSFPDSIKAWKLYRLAVGDFLLKQAAMAKEAMTSLDESGEPGAAEQYGIYKRYVTELQNKVQESAGKRSDIYTFDKKWVNPNAAMAAGVYMSSEQMAKKAGGALGEDEKLQTLFKKITTDIVSGKKPTAPVEKAREIFRTLGVMDEELVKLLSDADQFKRIGSELGDAWNLDELTSSVSRIRAALEKFARFNLSDEMTETQLKSIQELIKYLKSLENVYVSIANKKGKALEWGETGVTKVPKWESPDVQLALHRQNIKRLEEYMRRPSEEGGAKIGERQTYRMKVFGDAGETVKDQIVYFHKYGEGVNAAGQKVGQFSDRYKDMIKEMQTGGRTFRSAIRRVIMWGGAATLIYGGVSKLRDSIGLLSEVETRMAELRMVMSQLETNFGSMQNSAIGFAKQYGVPVTEILRSMKVFAQQGLKQAEVIDRTQASTLASNVTTLNATEATEALTAAMKVYRQEGDSSLKFLDAWSEIEAKHAITAGDMANALKKSASAAKNAGVNFDQLNGIVAGIGTVTRQSGKEVGTSLRFIFRRLSSEKGPKELAKLGIPVVDNKELRSGFDILSDLADKWEELTSTQKMNVAQAIGGTRQYNSLLVLMDNWAEALSAIEDSVNSKGSAERRNLELMKTYQKQFQQMTEAANELKIEFGKIYLPVAKTSMKGIRLLLETLSEIPTVVKAGALGLSLFFTYLAKGSDIIDSVVNRFRSGSSVFREFSDTVSKEVKIGLYESFGKGNKEDPLFKNLNQIGTQGGKSLDKFNSTIGKSMFMLSKWGRSYNKVLDDLGADTVLEKAGSIFKKTGGPMEKFGKTLNALSNPALAASIGLTPGEFFDDLIAVSMKAGGKGSEVVGSTMKKIGETFGSEAQSFAENWTSSNADVVKSVAPLLTTVVGLGAGVKSLYEGYGSLTKTASGYAKSMYNVKRADESELSSIRGAIKSYDALEKRLDKINKIKGPKKLIAMADLKEDAEELGNTIAKITSSAVVGYDDLGNAILRVSDNYRRYLTDLEKSKVKKIAEGDIKVLEKYIYELTETGGFEKFKNEIKAVAEEVPVIGEMIAKGIKVSPAKVLEEGVNEINKFTSLKAKYPLTTAFDEDIKSIQDKLGNLKSSYMDVYKDFRRVLSDISTKGLGTSEIEDIFNTDVMKKGFELMIKIEPRFRLAKNIKWQDVMGAEVMKRAMPEISSIFAPTAELTKANLDVFNIAPREGMLKSGDIVTFTQDVAKKFDMAGRQARVVYKESIDGQFEWIAKYYNTKTLEIEERPFDEVKKFVDQIFPLTHIKEDLSERMESLNEFVAGSSAGLRGITPKDFKRDLNLGERFFSEIPTSTILQGAKGFIPGTGFGESPFQSDWNKTFKDFYAKPSQEYKLQLEQLEKMRLEGLEGSSQVKLADDLYKSLQELQEVLKNNQVVLQYRAVFVDLTKTLEEGTRAVEERVSAEKNRIKYDKPFAGFTKNLSTALSSLDLGVRKYSEVTASQKMLMAKPELREKASEYNVNKVRYESIRQSIDTVDKALLSIKNISSVAKGFGSIIPKKDLKKFTETVAVTGDIGSASLKVDTGKIASNTKDTVDRLDKILASQGDPAALDRVLSRFNDYLDPRGIVKNLNQAAMYRSRYVEEGNTKMAQVVDKAMDELNKKLISTVGFSKAMEAVRKGPRNLPIGMRYTESEFQQRAFKGISSKRLIEELGKEVPKITVGPGYSARYGNLRTEKVIRPEFAESYHVKRLRKTQEEGVKEQLISSKRLAQLNAAIAVYSMNEKSASSKTLKKLDDQIKVTEESIKTAKIEGRPTTAFDKEMGSLRLAKEQEEKRLGLYKTAQTVSLVGGAATEFARALGASENDIKMFGLEALAAYGAMKVTSEVLGVDLPDAAKKFGRGVEDVIKKKASGEKISKGELGSIFVSRNKFMKQYKKSVEDTIGIPIEELKKEYEKAKPTFEDISSAKAKRGELREGPGIGTLTGAALAYTAAGYVAEKQGQKVRMATLEDQAKFESRELKRMWDDNSEAFDKVYSRLVEESDKTAKKKTDIETKEVSKVMDVKNEEKKIEEDMLNIRSKQIEKLNSIRNDTEKLGDALFKAEYNAQKLEESMRYTSEAMGRMEVNALERRYGGSGVLNKSLVGFQGEVELPRVRNEMSSQERLFTEIGDKFKEGFVVYSDILKELPMMRGRITDLMTERRTEALAAGDSDKWKQLTNEINSSKSALDRMITGLREFGEAAYSIDKLTDGLSKLENALYEISIQEAVESFPGMKEYKESIDSLLGGTAPNAITSLTAEESRRTGLGMYATTYEKKERELLYQLSRSSGESRDEISRQLSYLSEDLRREVANKKQLKENEQLRTQAEPFLEYIKTLEAAKRVEGADIKGLTSIQEDVIRMVGKSTEVVDRDQLISELKGSFSYIKNFFGIDQKLTKKEYEYELARIKGGGEKQYRGFPIQEIKGITGETRELRKELLEQMPTFNMDEMGIAVTDPIVSSLKEQTSLLAIIAEEIGVSNKDLAQFTEKKQTGGRIFGPGGPKEDKVNAKLSPGEYVIRAAAAQKLGYNNLEFMNKNGLIPSFADGGFFRSVHAGLTNSLEEMKKERMGLVNADKKDVFNYSKQLELATTEILGNLLKSGTGIASMIEGGVSFLSTNGIDGAINKAVDASKKAIGTSRVVYNFIKNTDDKTKLAKDIGIGLKNGIADAITEEISSGGTNITSTLIETVAGIGVAKKMANFKKALGLLEEGGGELGGASLKSMLSEVDIGDAVKANKRLRELGIDNILENEVSLGDIARGYKASRGKKKLSLFDRFERVISNERGSVELPSLKKKKKFTMDDYLKETDPYKKSKMKEKILEHRRTRASLKPQSPVESMYKDVMFSDITDSTKINEYDRLLGTLKTSLKEAKAYKGDISDPFYRKYKEVLDNPWGDKAREAAEMAREQLTRGKNAKYLKEKASLDELVSAGFSKEQANNILNKRAKLIAGGKKGLPKPELAKGGMFPKGGLSGIAEFMAVEEMKKNPDDELKRFLSSLKTTASMLNPVPLFEALLNIGTGTAATAVGGLAGMVSSPFIGSESGDVIKSVVEKGTYSPKAYSSQLLTKAIGAPFRALSNVSGVAGNWWEKATGKHWVGSSVKTAGESLPLLIPFMKGKKGAAKTPYDAVVKQLKKQKGKVLESEMMPGLTKSTPYSSFILGKLKTKGVSALKSGSIGYSKLSLGALSKLYQQFPNDLAIKNEFDKRIEAAASSFVDDVVDNSNDKYKVEKPVGSVSDYNEIMRYLGRDSLTDKGFNEDDRSEIRGNAIWGRDTMRQVVDRINEEKRDRFGAPTTLHSASRPGERIKDVSSYLESRKSGFVKKLNERLAVPRILKQSPSFINPYSGTNVPNAPKSIKSKYVLHKGPYGGEGSDKIFDKFNKLNALMVHQMTMTPFTDESVKSVFSRFMEDREYVGDLTQRRSMYDELIRKSASMSDKGRNGLVKDITTVYGYRTMYEQMAGIINKLNKAEKLSESDNRHLASIMKSNAIDVGYEAVSRSKVDDYAKRWQEKYGHLVPESYFKTGSGEEAIAERKRRKELLEQLKKDMWSGKPPSYSDGGSMPVYHDGGEVKKTGPIFAQKGEVISSGESINNMKSVVDSLNSAVNDLKDTIDGLGSVELKVADTILPIDIGDAKVPVDTEGATVSVNTAGAEVGVKTDNVSIPITGIPESIPLDVSNIPQTIELIGVPEGGIPIDVGTAANTIAQAIDDSLRNASIDVSVTGNTGSVGGDAANINEAIDSVKDMVVNLKADQEDLDSRVQMLGNLDGFMEEIDSKIQFSVDNIVTDIYNRVDTSIDKLRSSVTNYKNANDYRFSEIERKANQALDKSSKPVFS